MSIDEIKKLVMRFVDEPWNQGKVEVIDELCAPEYKLRYGTESEAGGREDLKKAAQRPVYILRTLQRRSTTSSLRATGSPMNGP